MTDAPLRRLIDLPGVDALELKALMQPRWAAPEALYDHPEIDAAVEAAVGISATAAEDVALPADWPDHLKRLDRLEPTELVEAFEREGWDVTDKRKPLRMLGHFALPLALAIRGVAGELPFVAEPDQPTTDWGSSLKADATRFRKR